MSGSNNFTLIVKETPGAPLNLDLKQDISLKNSRTPSIYSSKVKSPKNSVIQSVVVTSILNSINLALGYFDSKQDLKNINYDSPKNRKVEKLEERNSSNEDQSINFDEYYAIKEELSQLKNENEELRKKKNEMNIQTKKSVNKAVFMQSTLEEILSV